MLSALLMMRSADFTFNGLGYNVISEEMLTVKVADCGTATGEANISSTVSNNGKTYTVTEIAPNAFTKSKISSVTIPATVVKIGENAFLTCGSLTSIKFNAENCMEANNVFSGCSAVTSLVIGDEVTYIPANIFKGLTSLRSISIPRKVTNIGKGAFEGCTSVSSILFDAESCASAPNIFSGCTGLFDLVISDNVRIIPDNFMSEAQGLMSLTIGRNVETIGRYAFSQCRNLKYVVYNAVNALYLGYISDSLFLNGEKLSTVTIGADVEVIPDGLFKYCSGLSSVKWNSKLRSIGVEAFKGTAIVKFTAPASLREIGHDAFPTSLELVELNEGLENLSGFRQSKIKKVRIPSTVREIGDDAFSECSYLTTVENLESNTIERIGNNAFYHCYKLTSSSLNFGSALKSIGNHAFCDVTGIANCRLNEGLETVGEGAFISFKGFADGLILPSTIKNIESRAFLNCGISGTLIIPEGVSRIIDRAFIDNNIETLVYNAIDAYSNIYGGNAAFDSGIKNLILGKNIKSIGENMFYSLNQVKELPLPEKLETIGRSAFEGCTQMTFTGGLPVSLKSIERNAFANMNALTDITLPENLTKIDDTAFSNCTHLIRLTVKSKECLIKIPSDVKYLTLDKSMDRLSTSLLRSQNLKCVKWNVEIIERLLDQPNGSETSCPVIIGENVKTFFGMKFNTVISNAAVPPLVTNPLSNATAYVPDAQAYQADEFWSKYNIVQSVTWSGNTDGSNLSYTTNFPYELTLKHYLDSEGNVMTSVPAEIGDYKAVFTFNIDDEECELVSPLSILPNTTNTLVIDNMRGFKGREQVIAVKMNNEKAFTAFQFDLYLPAGVEVVKDEYGDYAVELSSRKSNTHTVAALKQPDGSIRVASYSSRNSLFSGNEGDLVYITVRVTDSATDGDNEIVMRNIRLSDANAVESITNLYTATINISGMIMGDNNDDGIVTTADVVNVVNYIMGFDVDTFVFSAADINSDGTITINDAVLTSNILLGISSARAKMSASTLAANNELPAYLTAEPVSIDPGKTGTFVVNMNNSVDITAFQTDIKFPAGVQVTTDEYGDHIISLSVNRATSTHQILSNYQPDGVFRVASYSTKSRPFKLSSGPLFEIEYNVPNDMTPGEYTVDFGFTELNMPDGTSYRPAPFSVKFTVNDLSGIDTVDTESQVEIFGVIGGVKVIAKETTQLTVFNISGSVVLNTIVSAGETIIPLKAGFYIANGKKLAVR